MFLKTLLLSGSVTMLYTASGGKPTSTLKLRLEREPLGMVTCKNVVERLIILYENIFVHQSINGVDDHASNGQKTQKMI